MYCRPEATLLCIGATDVAVVSPQEEAPSVLHGAFSHSASVGGRHAAPVRRHSHDAEAIASIHEGSMSGWFRHLRRARQFTTGSRSTSAHGRGRRFHFAAQPRTHVTGTAWNAETCTITS